jgi:hypothetical protein
MKNGRYITLLGSLAALVTATALAGVAAPAASAESSVNVETTLTATETWGWVNCCSVGSVLEGKAVIPTVGSVTFTGTWFRGCEYTAGVYPYRCWRTLSLAFVAPNGDTFTLDGANEWIVPLEPAPQELTWTIVGGTGRFAAWSGSGSYTIERSGLQMWTITLSGTLQPGGS